MYATKIIEAFNAGLLDVSPNDDPNGGTTLRLYLAEKLRCDPMRITKKFSGPLCLGKRLFRTPGALVGPDVADRIVQDLKVLEKAFLARMEAEAKSRRARFNSVAKIPSADATRKWIDLIAARDTGLLYGQDMTDSASIAASFSGATSDIRYNNSQAPQSQRRLQAPSNAQSLPDHFTSSAGAGPNYSYVQQSVQPVPTARAVSGPDYSAAAAMGFVQDGGRKRSHEEASTFSDIESKYAMYQSPEYSGHTVPTMWVSAPGRENTYSVFKQMRVGDGVVYQAPRPGPGARLVVVEDVAEWPLQAFAPPQRAEAVRVRTVDRKYISDEDEMAAMSLLGFTSGGANACASSNISTPVPREIGAISVLPTASLVVQSRDSSRKDSGPILDPTCEPI